MQRILMILAITATVSTVWAGRVQLVNLDPEKAQEFITQQSLDLRYAKKLGEYPLGHFRSIGNPVEAKFYHNGRLIDSPEDYVEEAYEASQFHGQDGLGRAMFGYTDYNQARLEARNANGEVRGSYQYMDPFGQEVVVQYWSDSLGFHQVDNRPEVVLEPVTDTPEVREARLAHMKAWEEAANLARLGNPIPVASKPVQNTVDDEEDEIVAALSNQHQSLVRYPSLPYTTHISPNAGTIASDDAIIVEAQRNLAKRQNEEPSIVEATNDQEEPQYDPKGFFYSFEYPVFNIALTEAAKARAQSQKFKRSNPESEVKKVPVPAVKTPEVMAEDKKPKIAEIVPSKPETAEPKKVPVPAVKSPEQTPESEQPADLEDTRVSLKAIQTGETLVAAVHDTQVSPKQKLTV
ncbi:uncharacterized protein LOC129755399 [Uranotaenia lowii]|uniref:uncharacterized protein LOC129755399 n=1 Tax=Uranotaenia lowii TaxID=190385 RepID=UPI002479FA6F|nr:uncharacterized protein LOC129755399 [Uranotaenia lowii]